jgi:uncharacterized membrane protein (UPF0127 family)
MRFLPHSTNKRIVLAFAVVIIAFIASWVFLSHPLYALTIKTADRDFPLRVELADTDESREYGLMNRTSLSPDKGMLFVFPEEKPLTFWMKNTLIPLDMVFIKTNGEIDFIHHNAHPEDLTPISSQGPVIAVLEIGGGQADKHGIKVGDIVKTSLLPGSSK